jgi:hypothetical protein
MIGRVTSTDNGFVRADFNGVCNNVEMYDFEYRLATAQEVKAHTKRFTPKACPKPAATKVAPTKRAVVYWLTAIPGAGGFKLEVEPPTDFGGRDDSRPLVVYSRSAVYPDFSSVVAALRLVGMLCLASGHPLQASSISQVVISEHELR